jgi:hypothetical protein
MLNAGHRTMLNSLPKFVASRTTSSGVIVSVYRSAGSLKTGTAGPD